MSNCQIWSGIQNIFQKSWWVLRANTYLWMPQCTFCFRSKPLNFFWMPERNPIIAGAPSVQTPQTYFHCNSAESKKGFSSGTPAFVVVVCSFSQNRSSASMSPEWIYLTKTSNWTHEVTSVDSSTWKENIRDAFIYHLVFHIFQHIWNEPLSSTVGKRYSPHFCLTSFSKRYFYCFQQTGFHNWISQAFLQSCR